jgi:MFS transporter, MHS family, proline/betaine transporter
MAAGAIGRRSMTLAAASTVVEWYDFTVYLYLATVLSRVFFGGGATSLAVTFAGFAIAYLLRPLGAIAFGHLGDRHGRRTTLLVSMAVMSAAMLATALLPTHAEIGPAAGWLLLALRCIMAFAVGGEYTGVVAYLLEGARPERRGLVTSSAAAASEVGGLLAVGVAAVTAGSMTTAALDGWGWRIPFLIGAVLAGFVWFARAGMEESPEFERQRAADTRPAAPLAHAVRRLRAPIARGFAISALGSITYYVGITYVPAFLTTAGAMSESRALWLSTGAAAVVIAVTPLVGALSDRVGRRPVLVALAIAGAVLPLAMFAGMASGRTAEAIAGAVVLAGLAGAVSAVGAVATAEQLPGEGRLSGLALGATGATAIFGGLAPLTAHLLVERTGWAPAPGAMIAAVALAVLPVLWRLPDPR